MNAVLVSLITLFSTTAGGLCALRLRAHLPLVLGFAAGVLLGIVSFDLLPESFALARRLGGSGRGAMIALAAGFLLFHAIERLVVVRGVRAAEGRRHQRPTVGVLSAAAFIGHSFMDGVGIGLAFQVSQPVGFTVAIAVIAHDFCDGLNTVSVVLVHGNPTRRALALLGLDAVAPVLGAAVSSFAFSAPPEALVIYLGFFAGVLLCIGATDILPRALARAGSAAAPNLAGLAVLGASSMYAVMRVTG
ncbi:MAG TPA: ZIP family metal transporter [Burkholderiaceae bacterium]|nr:ZIP family metal transporter [Burkholderiaceae bacterium]